MRYNKFLLSSKDSNLNINGGSLNGLSDFWKKPGLICRESFIDIILEEGSGLEGFEMEVRSAVRSSRPSSYLHLMMKNRIGSVITLIISLLIITLIALLSIHGSLTYDLFSSGNSSNILHFNGLYLYLTLSLVILLFLVVSPKIILGEYGSLFEWANSRFSTNARVIRRLSRELNFLLGVKGQDKRIRVWNPMVAGSDNWICTQLIPALSVLPCEVDLMIRTDERDLMLEVMKHNGSESLYSGQADTHPVDRDLLYPYDLLSVWEQECFHCLMFSSLHNLPDDWKGNSPEQYVYISMELAEQVYHYYGQKLSSGGSAHTTFEKFINRCVCDYNYMEMVTEKRVQNLILRDASLVGETDRSLMEAIGDIVRNNLGSISANISDPLALVILMGMIGTAHSLDTRKIDLVTAFIRNVKRLENFQLVGRYWPNISKEKRSEDGKFKLGLMQFIDVQTLSDLATCFVNSGMYTKALEVFDILENIYPARIAFERADLKDSLGEYKEALQIILKADRDWVESGIVEDKSLILQIYHLIAWVIVSGRFDDHKAEGYQYLAKTESILRKLPNAEGYLLYLTRHFNTTANYNEWEQDYQRAIENYDKALKLPGNILRKSSLLSNRGTAERFLGNKTDDPRAKRAHFEQSRSDVQQAVDMKKSIGEKNQLPGTTQNLAETFLELARIATSREEKVKALIAADDITSEGLEILEEIKSDKRRGRLLAKKYIAHYMLAEVGEASEKVRIREALDLWLQTEDKKSFDYREVMRLFPHFGIEL